MTPQTLDATTRASAAKLLPDMPEGFAEAVEAALARPDEARRETYMDPATATALGSLLVSAASLAWTIYRDLKSDTERPGARVVERKVRLMLTDSGCVLPTASERIIEVAVAEVAKADLE